MTATTALTAQNTKGVYDIHLVPPAFLRKQIDAVIEDVGVDVVKTGEYPSAPPPPTSLLPLGQSAVGYMAELTIP